MRAKLEEFGYDDSQLEIRLGECEARDMEITEDGARYQGEWLKGTSIRQGRGIQVWPSGIIYKGYWFNNLPNGYGRGIEIEGNVYDGEMKDGKKNGIGKCT